MMNNPFFILYSTACLCDERQMCARFVRDPSPFKNNCRFGHDEIDCAILLVIAHEPQAMRRHLARRCEPAG